MEIILRTSHADKVAHGFGREREEVAALTPISIWDIPEHGSRGPKGRHDRTAVAAAAIRLADAGGLDAVTMRAVAVELGIAPMSLYNYVPTKDHLIQLMIDMAAAEYRYPDPQTADRRAAIADLARQGRAITRRHPWLPDAIRRPAVIGPNALRYIDCLLGLLAGSGLDTATKMVFISLINGFAIMYGGMEATLASQQASTGVSPGQHQAAQVAAMASAAATGQYPNLAAAMAVSGPSRPPDADEVFDSCVSPLIDIALAGRLERVE
jgi:AcrR family transcriptional regulator